MAKSSSHVIPDKLHLSGITWDENLAILAGILPFKEGQIPDKWPKGHLAEWLP